MLEGVELVAGHLKDFVCPRQLGLLEHVGLVVGTTESRAANGECYVQPTVLSGVRPDMRLFREEIFGPVAPLVKFETEEEAVSLANDTEFGLAA